MTRRHATVAFVLAVAVGGCVAPPPTLEPPNVDAGKDVDDAGGTAPACAPAPNTATDAGSGYVVCGVDGLFEPAHRVEAVACVAEEPDDRRPCDPSQFGVDGGASVDTECMTDADCGLPHGRCLARFFSEPGCFCGASSCSNDADCGEGAACGCSEAEWSPLLTWEGGLRFGRVDDTDVCLQAECRTDADCGTGACMLSPDYEECLMRSWHVGLFCTTDEDDCRSDADCADENGDCAFDEGLRLWRCVDVHIDCWA